jgi:hypothetical protein
MAEDLPTFMIRTAPILPFLGRFPEGIPMGKDMLGRAWTIFARAIRPGRGHAAGTVRGPSRSGFQLPSAPVDKSMPVWGGVLQCSHAGGHGQSPKRSTRDWADWLTRPTSQCNQGAGMQIVVGNLRRSLDEGAWLGGASGARVSLSFFSARFVGGHCVF